MTTSTFAWIAIRRREIELHREWMIRSAVVTFAFVWFRIVLGTTIALNIGTFPERFTLAAWSCWSVPLLITEVCLQAKRLRAARPVREREQADRGGYERIPARDGVVWDKVAARPRD